MRRLEKTSILAFLALALLLSIFKIKSWDVWFHLSYGREVFKLSGIPETEVFLYPLTGQNIMNAEWLFGVLLYLFYYLFSIEGVILFKAAVCLVTMYILLKHSAYLTRNYAISIAVLIPILLAARLRFYNRPEIFFYLFVALTLYFVSIYVKDGKKYIYLLPVFTVAWANMHPSAVVAFFVLVVYIALGLAQMAISRYSGWRLEGVPDKGQCKTLFIILLLVIGASLITPFTLEQRLEPFQLGLSQITRDEVIEMMRPHWRFFMNSRGVVLLMVISSFILSWRRVNLPHLVIASFLVYSTLTVVRMYGPMAIVTGPMIAANFGNFYNRHVDHRLPPGKKPFLKPLSYGLVLSLIAFLIVDNVALGNNKHYEFGLGIKEGLFPEKAVQYVLQNDIRGNMLNTFHYGGYIEWRAYPALRPFTDGRGLFPQGVAEDYTQARNSKQAFGKLDEAYNLDLALFNYNRKTEQIVAKLEAAKDMGFISADWALVYWGENSLVYLARKPKYADIIERDEYKFVKPSNPINTIFPFLQDKSFRKGFLNEINRKLGQDPDLVWAKYLLAFFQMYTRAYGEALKTFSEIEDEEISGYLSFLKYQSMGEAYMRLGKADEAVAMLRKAIIISDGKDFLAYHLLAQAFSRSGEYAQALTAANEALELNPNFVLTRKLVHDIYLSQGPEGSAKKAKEKYQQALRYAQAEAYLLKGLKLFREEDYHRALQKFEKAIEIYPYNPAAHSHMAYAYYAIGDINQALRGHQRALELDPKWAESIHGLALIYGKQGNSREALKFWKQYLKIYPRGHWSRKARERIKELKR